MPLLGPEHPGDRFGDIRVHLSAGHCQATWIHACGEKNPQLGLGLRPAEPGKLHQGRPVDLGAELVDEGERRRPVDLPEILQRLRQLHIAVAAVNP